MNVLHVNNVDLQGRRFNGYDLLGDLGRLGINGKQAVLTKLSSDPDVVHILDGPDDERLADAIRRVEVRHGISDLLVPWGRVIAGLPEFQAADVVHYHLLHNHVVSLLDLPGLFQQKPSVWTWHDAWPLTGHCIQPMDCEGWLEGCLHCPFPDRPLKLAADQAHLMWSLKRSIIADLDVDIVVASGFMRDMIWRGQPIRRSDRVHLIPFGVSPELFLPESERARSRQMLGIAPDATVLLLRAAPAEFKGLAKLVDALTLRDPDRAITLLVVGTRGLLRDLAGKYKVIELGWVEEDEHYARILCACDIFVMPSLAEGFGMMALESMAAGRPVVCFEGTAPASITHAPECGLAVAFGDASALRDAIDSLVGDPAEANRRGQLGREIAHTEYSHEKYLSALTALYQSAVNRRR